MGWGERNSLWTSEGPGFSVPSCKEEQAGKMKKEESLKRRSYPAHSFYWALNWPQKLAESLRNIRKFFSLQNLFNALVILSSMYFIVADLDISLSLIFLTSCKARSSQPDLRKPSLFMGAAILNSDCWNALSLFCTVIHFLLVSIEWEEEFLLSCASWPKSCLHKVWGGKSIFWRPLLAGMQAILGNSHDLQGSLNCSARNIWCFWGLLELSQFSCGVLSLKNYFNILNKSLSLTYFCYKHVVVLLGYWKDFFTLSTCGTLWLLNWKETEPLGR